jgi:hypothetical protein
LALFVVGEAVDADIGGCGECDEDKAIAVSNKAVRKPEGSTRYSLAVSVVFATYNVPSANQEVQLLSL